ncbi:lipopolysaccharide biosynthesis protein [Acinetobacter sp. ANC 4648]|uniref:lipopolysaccharide biosynthesis protein n=1 Tax=Acinetobacter sp. ANC 4648 TaxID=1977875 RepID=UPI000A349163|nr:lipopolysaccharide biosynthesis protein [Acinetobacter sp. ANC 4648]OTG84717.1 lipopolysaccharide biosynthesis protein [Acinetobacter sp. ANC 4648]
MNNFFTHSICRNFFKFFYKITHSAALRHNRMYWPLFRVERDNEGTLNKVYFQNILIADNTILEKTNNNTAVLVATGPSIKTISPEVFKQTSCDYIGVNGAISLDIQFQYYVIIDHNFTTKRFDLVLKVLQSDLILFITPKCLDLILRRVKFKDITCKIKVIETITENIITSLLAEKQVENKNTKHYFYHNEYGFSTRIFHSIFDYFTVAYVALQVTHALQYEKIYIAGLDMNDFNTPRFYESKDNKQPTMLDQYSKVIFPAFDAAAQFFKEENIKVFNLSKTSAIESFEKK